MADSFDKFSIGIDADVSALQSSLKAAQNTLAQFEGALKKATNIGEINYLSKNIDNLKGKITQLNQQANNLGRPIGDASQSLINFSRIAQDAPYGIMGIANNLNPMVESFQRLSKTEGGTKNALKAMVAGLSGPAGVGVAIGVVSSLAVTFSKEISEFFKGPTEELEAFRKKLKETADDIYKLIGAEQTKRTKGIFLAELITGGTPAKQQEALKQLKDLYSNNAAIQNAKLGQDKKFYQTLVNQAAMQGDAVAKEKNNSTQLDLLYAKQKQNRKEEQTELAAAKGKRGLFDVKSVDANIKFIKDKYKGLNAEVARDIKNIESKLFIDLSKTTAVKTTDKKAVSAPKDALAEATKDFENSKKRNLALFDGAIIDQQAYYTEYIKILDDYINKLKNINTEPAIKILKSLTPKEIFKDDTYDADLERQAKGMNSFDGKSQLYVKSLLDPLGTKNPEGLVGKKKINTTKNELTEFFKQTEDGFKKAHEAANSFANDMSSNITSALQNAFQAVKQGENVFESLSNSVLQFAEDLLFAIIRAKLLAAIQGVIAVSSGGAAGAAAGGKGFFDILMGLLGVGQKHAAGGIVTSPQIGMIGEAGAEAIMPLSKLSGMLNTTFSAGAMSGGGGMGGNGSFVLRGNDLVLALQRSNSSLNLRRGGI